MWQDRPRYNLFMSMYFTDKKTLPCVVPQHAALCIDNRDFCADLMCFRRNAVVTHDIAYQDFECEPINIFFGIGVKPVNDERTAIIKSSGVTFLAEHKSGMMVYHEASKSCIAKTEKIEGQKDIQYFFRNETDGILDLYRDENFYSQKKDLQDKSMRILTTFLDGKSYGADLLNVLHDYNKNNQIIRSGLN